MCFVIILGWKISDLNYTCKNSHFKKGSREFRMWNKILQSPKCLFGVCMWERMKVRHHFWGVTEVKGDDTEKNKWKTNVRAHCEWWLEHSPPPKNITLKPMSWWQNCLSFQSSRTMGSLVLEARRGIARERGVGGNLIRTGRWGFLAARRISDWVKCFLRALDQEKRSIFSSLTALSQDNLKTSMRSYREKGFAWSTRDRDTLLI